MEATYALEVDTQTVFAVRQADGVGETKQNKQNKTKQNKTKQNKTKQNKTKQNKTKQNKTKRSSNQWVKRTTFVLKKKKTKQY